MQARAGLITLCGNDRGPRCQTFLHLHPDCKATEQRGFAEAVQAQSQALLRS